MMKEIKNIQEFNTLVRQDKPILLDFYADWCPPCKMLMPTIEKLAEKYKNDFEVVKINIDHNKALAEKFAVKSIPALFFIKDKTIMERLQGLQPEFVLDKKMIGLLEETPA